MEQLDLRQRTEIIRLVGNNARSYRKGRIG